MEALKACYGNGSSDSDSDSESVPSTPTVAPSKGLTPLPPPPISLLDPPNILVNIPSPSKKELTTFLKKVSCQELGLYVVDVDVPLNILCKNDEKLEQVALGREFHISLGRTVPIQVHQIDSMVSMLHTHLSFFRSCSRRVGRDTKAN